MQCAEVEQAELRIAQTFDLVGVARLSETVLDMASHHERPTFLGPLSL